MADPKVEKIPSLENGHEASEQVNLEGRSSSPEKKLKYEDVLPEAEIFLDPFRRSSFPNPTPELTTYGIKLGWIQGVLIPCLLNIWGVMLFLRIAWVVAQAGIGYSVLIIFMSGVVCVITTLSLSAICTNGELQGGGVYFLVSRSLGAEFGASVGIMFAFANAVAASMNTIGFCESLNDLLKSKNVKIIDNGLNDTRIIGAIALLVMCVICAIGMDWETKAQNFLIVIIVSAIINYYVGTVIGPFTDRARAEGFMGVSLELAKQNWQPDFRYNEGQQHNFFSVFAIYFPAVTGVQAGANICGDLRDPATAIPKGTLLALAISLSSYLGMTLLSGTGALRDASGKITDVGTDAISSCKPDCDYGLHNNYEIMQLMALWGPLIYGGCWAATLSTALTNLLSVPRLIQALGVDQIYPGLIFFSKPYGRHGEPYRGYVLVFVISLLFLLIADLNTIAPLITNFYLASYALINFCTFHAAYFRPLSWRPGFRYYNLWISLAGFLMCLAIMMVISWGMALLTTFIFLFLYLAVLYRKPVTTWGGGSALAQQYQDTIKTILTMSQQKAHSKSFNPQLLVMSGPSLKREWLLDMSKLITSVGSFMIVAELYRNEMTRSERLERTEIASKRLQKLNLPAFYVLVHNFDYKQAFEALLQCAGLGRLSPNIVLLGYKYDWYHSPSVELEDYIYWIRCALEFHLAVAILRVPRQYHPGVSHSYADTVSSKSTKIDRRAAVDLSVNFMPEDSNFNFDMLKDADDQAGMPRSAQPSMAGAKQASYRPLIFNQSSTLDAWWLYDEGGMNILLPYIIAYRSCKEHMSLRVFVLPKPGFQANDSQTYMQLLLAKLRIQYSEILLVDGINEQPADTTWSLFNSITDDFSTRTKSSGLGANMSDETLLVKTARHLRLRELLIKHSFGTDLIVMTLPYPREGSVPSALYMAWLEVMSRDLPPIMFVRGGQTSVREM